MNKEEKAVFYKFVLDNHIDVRTINMIIHHYLSLGEQTIANLTDEDIKEAHDRNLARQQEAEKRGKVYLIDASFVSYLLESCKALYNLPDKYRYKIIKEYLA